MDFIKSESHTMKNFKLSFIVPTYNRSGFLDKKIVNIQNLKKIELIDYEILIIDNSSEEKERESNKRIAAKYEMVRYIESVESNANTARNIGILNSKFDLLSISDDDDTFEDSFLVKLYEYLESGEKPDVLFSWAKVIDINNAVVGVMEPNKADINAIYKYNSIPASSCVLNKEIFAKTGLWNPKLKSCQDWELWLRIVLTGAEIGIIHNYLVNIHKHEEPSIGKTTNYYSSLKQINKLIKRFSYREYLKNELLIRKKKIFG